ncbi:MAG: protein translocase subunit SecD, partial [Pelagibacterales bacterium]|nr:protein translocase subunit SecD [Pelagibacterales bacterium]
MLYFSKIKIISIIIFTTIFVYFTASNFFKFDNNFIEKKINLGLDLQGGSYLLLEIDNKPVIIQRLQNKLTSLRKYFKKENINFKNLKIINNEKISFELNQEFVENFYLMLEDKNNVYLNPYYQRFNSHEFDFNVEDNVFTLKYSKYGLIELKETSLNQALEIVRRRIDEIGTNEPNILRRGSDRILVELPGLDDPERIKSLLGKTANLTFRFVVQSDEPSFGSEKMISEDGLEELIVSKRIIISGENLVDANPRMDNQSNETVVSFTLDRVGAKRFGKATTSGIGKRLAIVLDGKVISAPVIRDAIVSGSGQISGNFTFQTATDLSLLLRSGALPAPLNIIEERTVGPGLGQDSIDAGIFALVIGFFLVIFFMLFKYKIFGLIANFALIINLFLLVGILTLFEATLTLPGIAGIILTVGMAVDANVLIF